MRLRECKPHTHTNLVRPHQYKNPQVLGFQGRSLVHLPLRCKVVELFFSTSPKTCLQDLIQHGCTEEGGEGRHGREPYNCRWLLFRAWCKFIYLLPLGRDISISFQFPVSPKSPHSLPCFSKGKSSTLSFLYIV